MTKRVVIPLFLVMVGLMLAAPAQSVAKRKPHVTYIEKTCKSGRYGWKLCTTLDFEVRNCRNVGVRNLASTKKRWVRVQFRDGDDNVGATSAKLRPPQSWNGQLSGENVYKPRIYIDADGLGKVVTKLRFRFSGGADCKPRKQS